MIDKAAIAIAQSIGEFYLKKNAGDYDKTEEAIRRLRITEILPIGVTMVVIKLSAVGLAIGKRGENIDALQTHLNRRIFLIENPESIEDYLIPRPPDGPEDYEYDYPPEPDDTDNLPI